MERWKVYIREALMQLEFAERCYRDFEIARDRQDVRGVFFHLHHFIVHVANVEKLLNPKPSGPRAGCLLGHVDVSGIDLKSIRRLRNHMEHFDERLDMWIAKYDGHTFFDMNIVTGTKGFPAKMFLRALDGDTFKLHGEDYPLKHIHQIVVELSLRLSPVVERKLTSS
ncbi:MAG TPA: hypothetical protein VJ746_13485 [Nitrospira sp.]|nr:hypothetical protein [Nitrospira sp.]